MQQLRDIHDLGHSHLDDIRLARWQTAVNAMHKAAAEFTNAGTGARARGMGGGPEAAGWAPTGGGPAAPGLAATQRRLFQRIGWFIREPFISVADPHEPPDNSVAERHLRPLVVSRKIGCGSRRDRGTNSRTELAPLFGT